MTILGGLIGLGRRFQRNTMTATVRIRRPGPQLWDKSTGTHTPTWTTIYDGPAEIMFPDAHPRDVDADGQRLAEQQPLVKLPLDGAHATAAANVHTDDVGEILTCEHDPGSVGVTFRVMGLFAKSNATSRRVPVEVLTHA